MSSRVLSLWLPTLATDRIRHARPEPARIDGPIATIVGARGKRALSAICAIGQRIGLRPGMALADARALAPQLAVHPHEPDADAALLAKLADWCARFTPWVVLDRSQAEDAGGALWLDLTGCAHRFGGETAMRAELLAGLRRQGLAARAAIADCPGAAWAVARYAPADRQIVPPGEVRAALGPLPIVGLRLPAEQVAMLERSGLSRIEALLPLPRRALIERFGERLALRLDQALGLADEAISPHAPLPAHRAQMILAEPLTDPAALPPLVHRLLQQLGVGLEAAGLGARRLGLACYRVDGTIATVGIGTSRPCREVGLLARLLDEKLGRIEPGFGIERVILEAYEVEPLVPEPIAWRGLAAGDLDQARDLAPLIDRPGGRPLRPAVTRLVPHASHLPERTQIPAVSGLATALDLVPPAPAPAHGDAPARLLHLFRQPEPIEAIAPLPDEPPLLFRWRRSLHKVARACGPERIAPDWWREPGSQRRRRLDLAALTRDYFVVEDTDGGRFWLFREGLYGTTPATLPRWYLHGLFA
jgi:protein ImuB